MLITSIQQSARNALALWLTSELASIDGGISIEPRWWEPSRKLPPKAITIIDAGPRRIEWLDPECLSTANIASTPPTAGSVWQLGFAEQPLQLDVWAMTDVELDDIMARLDGALNKGVKGVGVVNADPFTAGLLLNLGDGWAGGTADYIFDSPDVTISPSSVNESEWRASYRGVANMRLTQTAITSRIAQINIKQRLRTVDPDDSTEPYDIITVTADGETHSTGL